MAKKDVIAADLRRGILAEITVERLRQIGKFGHKEHLPSVLRNLESWELQDYEIPSEQRAKFLTEFAFANGKGTWAHILIEEVSEAVEEALKNGETAQLEEELIQVAAVAVAWLEAVRLRR